MESTIVAVSHAQGVYDVVIGVGLFGELQRWLNEKCPAASYGIITDTTVGKIYGAEIQAAVSETAPCHLFSFPAGEQYKTRATWSALTDDMLAAGMGRDSAVIALGGGVAGDIGGFVAATFMRGIPCIQLPTSLLAMIDSSVGGKTGVDTPAGKNLVGAFKAPTLVLADIATLGTLPPEQMSCGLAEAIKHGAIADADYFESLETHRKSILDLDPDALIQMVRRSVEIKASVVSEDELELGRRAILNFGHTIGHAVETSSGYALRHGEAVSVGMVAEAQLGNLLGITAGAVVDRLRSALTDFNLPVIRPKGPTSRQLVEIMRSDKKSRDGETRVTLVTSIGEIGRSADGQWTHAVSEATFESLLASGDVGPSEVAK